MHRLAMEQKLTERIVAGVDWATAAGIPLVLGEGCIGYTPLRGRFEEGRVGSAYCRRAVAEASRVGSWGSVVCSNAAPRHPMWQETALQQECNDVLREPAV